jgi:glycosyltransferase involved in cell wall biosynthesis
MKKLFILDFGTKSDGRHMYAMELIKRFDIPYSLFANESDDSIKSVHKIYWHNAKSSIRNCSLAIYSFAKIVSYVFIGSLCKHYCGFFLATSAYKTELLLKIFRFTGKKVFFVVHDGIPHSGEEESNSGKVVYELPTNIIYLSSYVKNQVEQNLKIKKDCIIIPHGLLNSGDLPQQIKKYRKKPKLLFFGRLSQYKGLDNLIKAVESIDEDLFECLYVVGKSYPGYQIGKINSKKIIIEDREVDDSEIPQLFNSYDILVMPYSDGTQSGVATLAINYLIPTIVTNVGALKEQFCNDGAFFIEENDVLTIKNALVRLCEDKELYETLSINMLNVRSTYSWEKFSCRLQEYLVTKMK